MKNSLVFLFCFIVGSVLGQDVPPPLPHLLLINEIDYTRPGVDDAEFIEIHNPGLHPVSLPPYHLIFYSNPSDYNLGSHDTIFLPFVELDSMDYFVICYDSNKVENCDFEGLPSPDYLSNVVPFAVELKASIFSLSSVCLNSNGVLPLDTIGIPQNLADNDIDEFMGLSRIPEGSYTYNSGVDYRRRCITPGEPNGTDSLACNTITSISGINELAYSINPNPASGLFKVQFKETFTGDINLYTQTGQRLLSQSLSNQSQSQLDVSHLAAGIYFLELDNGVEKIFEKVVVNK